ncbi:hypothetical protein IFM89_032254 [Coptis chinensis]|uniref:Uncharacterized protein n=1 Tax=Coptis chinensis TaxID=261450 RepID=A0A835M2L6_9MAGN|nr:hypothetical protein IFM89_032254 [Coptis chinensis]
MHLSTTDPKSSPPSKKWRNSMYVTTYPIPIYMLKLLCLDGTPTYKKMNFEEFCSARIRPYQLETLEGWEQIASTAFEYFEQKGNWVISVEELARVLMFYVEWDYFQCPTQSKKEVG